MAITIGQSLARASVSAASITTLARSSASGAPYSIGRGTALFDMIKFLPSRALAGPHTRDIDPLIEKIKHAPDGRTRSDLALELARVVNWVGTSEQFGDRVIDDMASLLDDRAVRFWIAPALGELGTRAKRAVPALEKALEDEEVVESAMMLEEEEWERAVFMNRGLSVANAIRLALARIEVPLEE